MEGRWPFALFVLLLIALHFLLRIGLGLEGTAPDLLTVALLLTARRVPAGWAAGVGLLMGLLRDSVNLTSFGADAVVMTVLGFLGARSRDYFVGESVLFLLVYLLLGKWLHDIAFHLISGGMATGEPFSSVALGSAIAAVYAAVAGVVALSIYRALARE